MKHRALIAVAIIIVAVVGWMRAASTKPTPRATPGDPPMFEKTEIATLAGGCFWCTEAVFDQIPGVLRADSGYTGGQTENPTYEEVCTGHTGHAEALEIEFDPRQVSFEQLLAVFWEAHDPTQLNRQGNDVGTQYRSAIFYHNDAQRAAAEASIAQLNASGTYSNPVVTEVVPATTFYKAEDHHQEYYVNNRSQGYCRVVIRPKLEKLGLLP